MATKDYYKSNPQASDLLEIITEKGNEIYKDLKKAGSDLKNLEKVELVLDYHNVLDLFDSKQKLFSKPIGVVSFVGRSGKTREDVRKAIKERISTGQVKYGVLVFTRVKDEAEMRPRHLGTKSWVIGYICAEKCLFLDDSEDHILLANKSNIKGLTSTQVGSVKEILKNIKEIV